MLIRQRYSWNRAAVACTDATISSLGLIGDNTNVNCVSGTCPSWTPLNSRTYCTDYSVGVSYSSGEKYDNRVLNLNTQFSFGFVSFAWFGALVVGANGAWNVVNRINTFVRPDGYINSSPVVTTLPVIYKAINVQHVHIVQMADFDSNDVLKCRWSLTGTSNYNGYNECASVCSGVPGAVLFQNNCTLVFTLTQNAMYAAVALQIEDYYSSSSSTPMSSVPLQFLFYGYTAPTGCSTPPVITGVRPNRGRSLSRCSSPVDSERDLRVFLACIGTPIGSNVTEYVIAEVGCSGKTIIDFVSNSIRAQVSHSLRTGTRRMVVLMSRSVSDRAELGADQ